MALFAIISSEARRRRRLGLDVRFDQRGFLSCLIPGIEDLVVNMPESQAQDVPVSKNQIYTGTHPTARSQALSLNDLVAGDSIMTTTPLSAILLPSEKGNRCDNCFVRRQVQKCSGCGSYVSRHRSLSSYLCY